MSILRGRVRRSALLSRSRYGKNAPVIPKARKTTNAFIIHPGASNVGNRIDAACTSSPRDHGVSRRDANDVLPFQLTEKCSVLSRSFLFRVHPRFEALAEKIVGKTK